MAWLRARIYAWAYRLMRNHDDALDATQEVLIKWLSPRRAGVEQELAWLRRTTINHCIDGLRRRQRSDAHRVQKAVVESSPVSIDREELRRSVVDALGRLSDAQRAVMVAKVYDQETFAQIAESMGLSVSTVKTHYVRGLTALQSALRSYEHE